jgi:NadR type nicotinamide-nucleotide adenylyltransferase
MEKKMEETGNSCIRVILTGPESTGKTELALKLADKYNTLYVPEYAREYIEKLNRPYNYADIEHIAKYQVRQMKDYSSRNLKILFVDTYLLITRVWFDWVFNKYPGWLDEEFIETKRDLYLLCKPDIPWYPDNVRENGGEKRDALFGIYENELKRYGMHYRYVSGTGKNRIVNASEHIERFISEHGINILPDE